MSNIAVPHLLHMLIPRIRIASQPSSPTHDSGEEPEDEPSLCIGLALQQLANCYAAHANDPWNYMKGLG